VGIAAVLEASNPVAWGIAIATGAIITGFAVNTKYVWNRTRRRSIWFLRAIWALAVGLDIYTTIVGTVHFVVLGRWFDADVETSVKAIQQALAADPTQAVVTSAVTLLITLCPIAVPFAIDNLDQAPNQVA
jgi:uncharacterized protein YacL